MVSAKLLVSKGADCMDVSHLGEPLYKTFAKLSDSSLIRAFIETAYTHYLHRPYAYYNALAEPYDLMFVLYNLLSLEWVEDKMEKGHPYTGTDINIILYSDLITFRHAYKDAIRHIILFLGSK